MKDLKIAPRLDLDWTPTNAPVSLQKVFVYVMDLTDEAINWYIFKKKTKQFFAIWFRVLSIILGAVAALLPTIGQLFAQDGKSVIDVGWTVVLGGIVGTLLLLDKFFGFSKGWMRFISTELQLRQMEQEFQIDWESERACWEGNTPNKDQIVQMMARCKTFITQANNLVREETNQWIAEFERAIRVIDDSAQVKPVTTEPYTQYDRSKATLEKNGNES